MLIDQSFEKARFTYRDPASGPKTVPVNFNPVSLEHTITANSQGEGGQTSQVVGAASAKLSLELLFDTTDTGEDVRRKTHEIELMLKPAPGAGGQNAPPAVAPSVTFEWGAFAFEGVIDSFKQTMDYFSANGVPLRASVTLSLSQPNYKFDQQDSGRRASVAGDLVLPGGNPSSLAALGGDPGAARGIAAANGLESLRAEAGGAISVGGGVSIGAAASFSAGASGGGGFGLGAGAGGGASIGLGVNVGAGAGFGAQASTSISDGAFASLHETPTTTAPRYFETQRLLAAVSAPAVAPGAAFDIAGKAITASASGLKAEVGSPARLRFED